jgi:hypothetical protein
VRSAPHDDAPEDAERRPRDAPEPQIIVASPPHLKMGSTPRPRLTRMSDTKIKAARRKSATIVKRLPKTATRPHAKKWRSHGIIAETLFNATEASLSRLENAHFSAERRKHETPETGDEPLPRAQPEL